MRISHTMILAYQLVTGSLESGIGVSLVAYPTSPLNRHILRTSDTSAPFVSLAGMFIFTLGLCELLGAFLEWRRDGRLRLQTLSLIGALIHSGAAILLTLQVIAGKMAAGCSTIAITFGILALSQAALLKWLISVGSSLVKDFPLPVTRVHQISEDWRRRLH